MGDDTTVYTWDHADPSEMAKRKAGLFDLTFKDYVDRINGHSEEDTTNLADMLADLLLYAAVKGLDVDHIINEGIHNADGDFRGV